MPAKPSSQTAPGEASLPMAFGQRLAESLARLLVRAGADKVLPPLPAQPSFHAQQLGRPNTPIPR